MMWLDWLHFPCASQTEWRSFVAQMSDLELDLTLDSCVTTR
jgi:hypothetical protein